MSFSDNLENNLKNLESRDERDGAGGARGRQRRRSDRARTLAAAPFAEQLKNGPFTAGLMRHATRIGFGWRTKVYIVWLGGTLRLEAREHRLELRPTPDGVMAHWLLNGQETRKEKVDLAANPETLARRWLDTVGPTPRPAAPDPELES
ncbi:MAG: hypothetical protein HYR60_04220 [Acidobacteria bacterium]|nr:hypothetical protein [Acidobacteriota bacterium]MBI3472168.1 hypothetical protein [Candidatus Solibacter usitatus]